MPFPISGVITSNQYEKLNKISNDKGNTERLTKQTLDKDSFLKLMMTQLQNQDPLEPMDNSQTIAQMAQFSSVEQLSNISSSMEDANAYNGEIFKQLQEMNEMLKMLVIPVDSTETFETTGTDSTTETTGTGDTTETTGTTSAATEQTKLLEQNQQIISELMKLNNTMWSYFGTSDTPTDEDLLASLGN